MFSTDRDQLRKVFFDAWQKYKQHLPIEPLEAQLIEIMLLHPEYHSVLDQPDNFHLHDFAESNPFLHMSLHLAIREQVNTNRPAGIQAIYQQHCVKSQDAHIAEHIMMDCLAEVLWQAQQDGKMPDEENYLRLLLEK